MKRIVGAVLAAVMLMTAGILKAQSGSTPMPTANNSAISPALAPEMLTKTVHETWVDSGRDEDKFFSVVKAMAEMSAQKRGLTLPTTKEAGRQMGMYIKDSSRNDPDQLLYAVVDAALRQSAGVLPNKAVTQ